MFVDFIHTLSEVPQHLLNNLIFGLFSCPSSHITEVVTTAKQTHENHSHGLAGILVKTSSNGHFFLVTVTGEFPSLRSMRRTYGVLFDLRRNKRLRKQSRRRWFETPWYLLWRDCDVICLWLPAQMLHLSSKSYIRLLSAFVGKYDAEYMWVHFLFFVMHHHCDNAHHIYTVSSPKRLYSDGKRRIRQRQKHINKVITHESYSSAWEHIWWQLKVTGHNHS